MISVPAGTVTILCWDTAEGMMQAIANTAHKIATVDVLELRI
jgi:hypothetical protein